MSTIMLLVTLLQPLQVQPETAAPVVTTQPAQARPDPEAVLPYVRMGLAAIGAALAVGIPVGVVTTGIMTGLLYSGVREGHVALGGGNSGGTVTSVDVMLILVLGAALGLGVGLCSALAGAGATVFGWTVAEQAVSSSSSR